MNECSVSLLCFFHLPWLGVLYCISQMVFPSFQGPFLVFYSPRKRPQDSEHSSHSDCLLRPAEWQVLSHKQTHTAPPDPLLAPYEVVLSCLPTVPPQTALFTSAEDQGLVKDQTARKGRSSLTCQSAFFSPTLNLLLTVERMPRFRLSALTLNIQNPEEGLRGSSGK